MIQRHSPFLKLEDYINCFADTTPWDELQTVPQEPDKEEAAYKWLAVAILHALASRTDRIELTLSEGGEVQARTPSGSLPTPDRELAPRVLETVRRVVHLEGTQESVPFALGIRDDSLECRVEAKRGSGTETLTIHLPVVGTA